MNPCTITEALAQFTDWQKARRRSERTVIERQKIIGTLVRHQGDVDINTLTPRDMDQFFLAFNWSPGTVNIRVSTLKTFFRFCRARGLMAPDHDPMLGWRSVPVGTVERLRIPHEEWDNLLDHCDNMFERIIIATGLYLFLRVSEQETLMRGHVDLKRDEVRIYRTKTKEHDTMPIPLELRPYLEDHLDWLASQGGKEPGHYLIPYRLKSSFDRTEDGSRWLRGTQKVDPTRCFTHGHRVVQNVLERAGYPKAPGLGVHTLRRSGARAYFDSMVADGYDGALRRVQSMLGHKNSITTEIYLGLDLDRHTRNNDLAGKRMFPARTNNVTWLRGAQ